MSLTKSSTGLRAEFPHWCLLTMALGFHALLAPGPALAQAAFALACRAGGNMKLIIRPELRSDTTRIEIRFSKARASLTTRRPGPGECTWWDRPLNAREPTLIRIRLKATIWTEFKAIGSGYTSAGVVSSPRDRDRAHAALLLRVVRRGGCFVLQARNSNAGYFTSLGTIQDGC